MKFLDSFKIHFKEVVLFFLLCLCFIFFSNPDFLFNNTVFYIFQARDIQRAIDVLYGKHIFYGPELTGGGHLPGSLYYYLMSAVLWVKTSWVSVWTLHYFAILIACLFACFSFFKKQVSDSSALLWMIIVASHSFTSFFIRVFLNVSMMLPFAICALLFIIKSFDSRPYYERKKYYFIACLTIGLGLHFHFSLIFFFLALTFLHIFSKVLNLSTLNIKHLAFGVALFSLPLLPYYVWAYCHKLGIHFGAESFYTGQAEEVASTLFYLAKKGLEMPTMFKLQNWSQKIIYTIPLPLFVLFVVANFKKFWVENKVLIICFIFSLLPYALWLLSPQAIRYTILTYVSAIFITVKLFQDVNENEILSKKFTNLGLIISTLFMLAFLIFSNREILLKDFIQVLLNLVVACVFLLILNWKNIKNTKLNVTPFLMIIFLFFIPSMMQKENILKFNDSDRYMPNVSDWKHIWSKVSGATGWNYDEARKRLYFIGHHMSQSPELGYGASHTSIEIESFSKIISGFIISNRRVPISYESDVKWILTQNLPSEVYTGIKERKIVLHNSISTKMLIMPYYIIPDTQLPEYFQNISEGYRYSLAEIRLEKFPGNKNVHRIDENNFVFKWNECPGHNKFCSVGVLAEVKRYKSEYVITAKIIGSSLSQITPWISPEWNQAWIRPYALISCDGKNTKYEIASSVGYSRKLSYNLRNPFFQGNNSILAPLDFKIKFKCKSSNLQLAFGRESSLVDKVTEIDHLNATELSVSL